MTEVRLWAAGRSEMDVYDNRESYLKLAEKRKRLAFKIKAGAPPPTTASSSEQQPASSLMPALQSLGADGAGSGKGGLLGE